MDVGLVFGIAAWLLLMRSKVTSSLEPLNPETCLFGRLSLRNQLSGSLGQMTIYYVCTYVCVCVCVCVVCVCCVCVCVHVCVCVCVYYGQLSHRP